MRAVVILPLAIFVSTTDCCRVGEEKSISQNMRAKCTTGRAWRVYTNLDQEYENTVLLQEGGGDCAEGEIHILNNETFYCDSGQLLTLKESKKGTLQSGVECEGWRKRVVYGKCEEYLECKEGVVVHGECPWLQGFDQHSLSCTYTPSCAEGPTCEAIDRRPLGCECHSKYYWCRVDKYEVMPCLFDTVYDLLSGTCLPESKATCGPCLLPGPLTPRCENGTRQRHSPLRDCSQYQECEEGVWVDKNCTSWCKEFDGLNCVWKWKSNCIKPECEDYEVKPDSSSCKTYYECEQGKFVAKSCGTLHDFDKKTNSCSIFFFANC